MTDKRAAKEQLLRVYDDLEGLIKGLRKQEAEGLERTGSVPIDVKKLLRQLSSSKKRLERKLGNTILLEREQLKRKLRLVSNDWRSRSGRH